MSKLRTANLLGALSGEVVGRLERRLKGHPNATDSAVAALNVLGFWDGCSNAELARVLGLSHPATVRLVDKLEAAGLAEARPGRDRRAVALHLTEAGRTRMRAVLTDRCVALAEVTEALTPAEQDQLAGLLEKLLRGAVTSPERAGHICRLCDEIACPEAECPVHLAAMEMSGAGSSPQVGDSIPGHDDHY
jgi:DNA-binding MarR family transcriptional regulator